MQICFTFSYQSGNKTGSTFQKITFPSNQTSIYEVLCISCCFCCCCCCCFTVAVVLVVVVGKRTWRERYPIEQRAQFPSVCTSMHNKRPCKYAYKRLFVCVNEQTSVPSPPGHPDTRALGLSIPPSGSLPRLRKPQPLRTDGNSTVFYRTLPPLVPLPCFKLSTVEPAGREIHL